MPELVNAAQMEPWAILIDLRYPPPQRAEVGHNNIKWSEALKELLEWLFYFTWRIILSGCKWWATPLKVSHLDHLGHLEGEQPYLGD